MLSTLALRKAGSKAITGIRLFSLTPKQLASPVTTTGEEQKWDPTQYPTSGPLPLTLEEKMSYWKEANEIFFGPQRDLKNFPHPEFNVKAKDTYQFGFIPTRWFKAIYPQLGVTGCYTLVWGTLLFLVNKELYLTEHEAFEAFIAVPLVLIGIRSRYGERLKTMMANKRQEDRAKFYEIPLENAKRGHLNNIASMKEEIWRQDAIPAIFQAKQEQLDLQLEAQYRQRLHEAYETVRKRLEYQADIEFAQRTFEQHHMVSWIVDNVKKSITPQQEKETISSCIKTLKNLSASAQL